MKIINNLYIIVIPTMGCLLDVLMQLQLHCAPSVEMILCFVQGLKVPDGAAEGPVFMHCAPPSRPWQ